MVCCSWPIDEQCTVHPSVAFCGSYLFVLDACCMKNMLLYETGFNHAPKAQAACLHDDCNKYPANPRMQASRIAYGQDRRFRRVVTLAGQLIANSGTMSGGGRPVSGKMALGSAAPRGTGDAKVHAVHSMHHTLSSMNAYAPYHIQGSLHTKLPSAMIAAPRRRHLPFHPLRNMQSGLVCKLCLLLIANYIEAPETQCCKAYTPIAHLEAR